MPTNTQRDITLQDWEAQTGRTLVAFQHDHEYMEAYRSELTGQYPDEWIAVLDEKVVGHDRDHAELLGYLEDTGTRGRWPAIQLMRTKEISLIL